MGTACEGAEAQTSWFPRMWFSAWGREVRPLLQFLPQSGNRGFWAVLSLLALVRQGLLYLHPEEFPGWCQAVTWGES